MLPQKNPASYDSFAWQWKKLKTGYCCFKWRKISFLSGTILALWNISAINITVLLHSNPSTSDHFIIEYALQWLLPPSLKICEKYWLMYPYQSDLCRWFWRWFLRHFCFYIRSLWSLGSPRRGRHRHPGIPNLDPGRTHSSPRCCQHWNSPV